MWYNVSIVGNEFHLVSIYPYIISWYGEIVKEAEMFGECPICGESLEANEFEEEGNEAWRLVHCNNEDCLFEYQEVFTFSHNETVGSCIKLDEHGKEVV
jgi:hypothetical protein